MKNYGILTKKAYLALILLPAVSWPLTNGPAMPEYSSFEPIDAPDMVQLPTGSFQYSIPVLTVPGPELSYPIALSYHADVKAGEEASWVGLGWNVQPGAITRQVNKIPDDYRRSAIYDYLKSETIIAGSAADASVFGISFGLSVDTYHGYGGMIGIHIPNTNIGVKYGWNGVYDGIGVSLSYARFGVGINYSKGTFKLSANVNLADQDDYEQLHAVMSVASIGVSLGRDGITGLSTSGFLGGQQQDAQEEVKTDLRTHSSGPLVFFSLNDQEWTSWLEGYNFNNYYGYIYGDVDGMDCRTNPNNCSNHSPDQSTGYSLKVHEYEESPDLIYVGSSQYARMHATTQDNYVVAAQGIGGIFKPFRREDGDYLNILKNTSKYEWDWFGGSRTRINRTKTLEENRNALYKDNASKEDLYWRFLGEPAIANRSETDLSRRDIGEAIASSSKKIIPVYDNDAIFGRQSTIRGFRIIKEDGAIYEFMKPVYILGDRTSTVYEQEVLDKDVDFNGSQTKIGKYAYAWLLTAIKAPDFVNPGSDPDNFGTAIGGWIKFNYETLPTPYDWVSPYVDKVAYPDYTPLRDFQPSPISKSETIDEKDYATGRVKSEGRKEVAYLKSIETSTHIAEFITSDRLDGNPATKPLAHKFERSPCSGECVRPATYMWKNQFLIPAGWTGIREGDKIVRRHFTAGSASYAYDKASPITLIVQKCDKSGWDPSLMTSDGVTYNNYANLCVVVPDAGGTPEYPMYSFLFEFSYVNDAPAKLKRLDKIVLRSKLDILNESETTGLPAISHVSFKYDYSLCPNTPNSLAPNKGKLTLNSVQFGSDESGPELPPYKFQYNDPSHAFQSGAQVGYEKFETDRWGFVNHQASDMSHWTDVNQVTAWALNTITLPSGGVTKIEYESNRFRYVGPDEYFRDASGGYWAANWHQETQYSPSREIVGNPLAWLGSVTIKALEITFTQTPNSDRWSALRPQLRYSVNGTSQFLTMPQSSDPPSPTMRWVLPASPEIPMTAIQGLTITGAEEKKWLQVSILISPLADRTVPGGGVRVKSVELDEPIRQKTNKIEYTYFDGSLDALPGSYSGFDDTHLLLGSGKELYQGTSNTVFYSRVRTKMSGNIGYSDFFFFTPHDGAVAISDPANLGNDASGHPLFRIVVNDFTSLWGSLIKKQDFSEGGTVPVKEEGTTYILPQGSGLSEPYIQDGFPKWGGKTDIFNPQNLDVDAANAHFGFGVHTTASSARYFYLGCYVSSGCTTDPPISTTQIVHNRYTPHLFETYSKVDGVSHALQHYDWDASTGQPLMERQRLGNEWLVKQVVPAYSIYPAMLANNELTQEYSTTSYYYHSWPGDQIRFYTDPSGKLLPVSYNDPTCAVSGSVTRWRPYNQNGNYAAGASTSAPSVWRKYEELQWRDQMRINDPPAPYLLEPLVDGCTQNSGTWNCTDGDVAYWIGQGKVLRYSTNGTPLEFLGPSGGRASQVIGYRNSLVTAFAQNSTSKDLFYEGFENESDALHKMVQSINNYFNWDNTRAKTGAKSMKVYNEGPSSPNLVCFELGNLEASKDYTASVWFYDTPDASLPTIKPGMTFGGTGGCYSESFPTGLATKSGKWVRFQVGISAAQCTDASKAQAARLCLYASKGEAGPEIRYDELRVQPASALVTTYSYDNRGQMITATDPNEVSTHFEYNRSGNLMGIRNDDGVLIGTSANQLGAK